MATTNFILQFRAILSSMAMTLLFIITLHSQTASSFNFEDADEDPDVYFLDRPFRSLDPRGNEFLVSLIKKGARCSAGPNNICKGVAANKGASLLNCCKKHCRNILGDKNNCGECGHKCKFGQLCCHGRCTNGFDNVNHCGKCNKKCPSGVKCEFGTCGYA